MLGCVACGDGFWFVGLNARGGVRVGTEWERVFCLMFFNINILFTFIFVWCAVWVVTGGARGVFVSV